MAHLWCRKSTGEDGLLMELVSLESAGPRGGKAQVRRLNVSVGRPARGEAELLATRSRYCPRFREVHHGAVQAFQRIRRTTCAGIRARIDSFAAQPSAFCRVNQC